MMAISCAGLVLAQDIISLKNGERIENVTVSSVTDTTIVFVKNGREQNISKNIVLLYFIY